MEADAEGRPAALTLRGRRLRVVQVQDAWRIDDEWWRGQPVSRLYWRLVLEDGRALVVYRDLTGDWWYRQVY